MYRSGQALVEPWLRGSSRYIASLQVGASCVLAIRREQKTRMQGAQPHVVRHARCIPPLRAVAERISTR